MTNFKTLILITAGLILVGCGDPRADDKVELTNSLIGEMSPGMSAEEKENAAACVVDIFDAELSDTAWTGVMFFIRNDREGAKAWADENDINENALEGELQLAFDKAEESCDTKL
tara:strand:- start:129 stop:473 length:345 start_codon:yes stop_codon:yes gene_type:complete